MNDFKELGICDLESCQLFFEDPIVLPCGSTICKEHVTENCNDDDDQFFCEICDEKHPIPVNGFPINKLGMKIIKKRLHFNEIQKKIADSNERLESVIKEHESLNSDNLIYDYFSNLRNEVDLHREQLIEQINKRSDEIIKQLKEMEESFKLNTIELKKLNID